MAGNDWLSISSISKFFKDNTKQLKIGEIEYKDNHVLKFISNHKFIGMVSGEICYRKVL
jgi:hypothetical protein